ncbi:hypothetical protein [Arthrobacter dokdonensis]|uniref:hypothetical protein n=1 Tax=Arthrobacter dokdonellae TaxID=2211210 RepID=UPI0014947A8C|nr:hypothetical protein [Arthrobacter dokdonellae]
MKLAEDVNDVALKVRAALESAGLVHGPIRLHDKIVALGMEAPSVVSLVRNFRERNVARAELRKKPRTAYRRFVYPALECLLATGAYGVRSNRRAQVRGLPAPG